MPEPENMVLHLLQEMREDMHGLRREIADVRAKMATKDDATDLRSAINSLRADVASDLMTLEKRTSEQIVGLRRAVVEYHSSVVGHGLLIGDLDDRVRRLETAPSGSH